jgi:ethylbenzene hydroxylase subunit beta/complex iron-sulfur molybdoenzyme family reductase subunit beta
MIFVGMLDDEKGPIHRLVYEWKVALPLHPEFDTEPNVFYVPPLSPFRLRENRSIDTETMRIPPEYLESLFGPGVHEALATLRREIERVRGGGRSEILDTLIVYEWKSLFGEFGEEPAVVDAARKDAR